MHGTIGSAYLAPEGLEATLEQSLGLLGAGPITWHGSLALSAQAAVDCPWAQDIWTAPMEHPAVSVKAAADVLRGCSGTGPPMPPGSIGGWR